MELNRLFKKLDNYIEEIYPRNPRIIRRCCPNYNKILSSDSCYYLCSSCGMILKEPYELIDYNANKSIVVKTYINYSPSTRHIARLHKWSNYDRIEVITNNLLKSFDDYDFDYDITRRAKIIFKKHFNKIKIRGNVKKGLICYSFYKAHLISKINIDIDLLFNYFEITQGNYNDAVKKLDDYLYYPENLNKYLKMINKKIDKNKFIRDYNKVIKLKPVYNNKTLIISLLLKYLNIDNDKKQLKDFIKIFNISDNSLFIVSCYFKQNNI